MSGRTNRTIVGITGAPGMLGTHTRALLHVDPRFEAIAGDRTTFQTSAALDAFVSRCDTIVHYAGLNRGLAEDVRTVNVGLAQALVDACERADRRPHIVFASSTHIARDTPYGAAKRECTAIFERWATKHAATFTNFILPHVFGEGGKPFHNSVVATFARQLATGERPQIDVDGELELLHASHVAMLVRDAIATNRGGERRPSGTPLRVSELLENLCALDQRYREGIVPELRDAFDRELFNVVRTERYAVAPIVDLVLRSDSRGTLFETVKTINGGQSFVSTTKPGITRGEHFHFKKLERFIVLRGQATIAVRHLFDGGVQTFAVSGERPQFIDMPTLHPHNITNVGDAELITQFWTDVIFDPENPDTFAEKVGNR